MTPNDSDTESAAMELPTPPLTGPVLSNMLLGEEEFAEPVQLLRDLTGDQAAVAPSGAPESIGQIVAHMSFWQHRNLAVIRGEKPAYPSHPEQTWAHVQPDQWPDLVSGFLSDLDELMGMTENDQDLSRDLGEDETVGDRIRWTAVHNAYHFGQIVLLRRMAGIWPPEGGED
jgi:uncharacterized damage-inducible protein DinB